MATDLKLCHFSQSMRLSFTVPLRHPTDLRVALGPNSQPENTGLHLIFPEQPMSVFMDFPVCNTTLEPSLDSGYAAIYGWMQIVREVSSGGNGAWEMDPVPITADLDTPFVWFGPAPTLFDAPFRINRTDMDWTAWSFLTYIEDSLVSKSVRPVLAFEWGFKIEREEIKIKSLRLLDGGQAWESQRSLFERKFSGWTFNAMDPDVKVTEVSKTP